jgi:hypothetical protein
MVHVLRSAPIYKSAGRLDSWEDAYQYAAGKCVSSPIDQLLESIFSLGRHNLYTRFDEPGTWERYQNLAREFTEAEIPTPESPDLSDW